MTAALYQPFPMRPGHQAQAWRHQPAYRRPRHFHREPELNLVFAGRAVMGVGSRALEMAQGDVLLIRPGQDHELLSASADLELFVVAVTPLVAERCLRGSLPMDARPFALSAAEATRVFELLLGLNGVTSRQAVEQVIGDLFGESEGRLGRGHPVTRKAFQATTEAPAISADALARRLHVHPSELGRHFRRDLGLRFVEFRTRLRLMQFIEHVDRGQTLSRAAVDACFGSYTQCHRTFQRYLGCSPQSYFAGLRSALDERLAPADLTAILDAAPALVPAGAQAAARPPTS